MSGIKYWAIEFGYFPGILFGIRTYGEGGPLRVHVLYLLCFDIALRIIKEEE